MTNTLDTLAALKIRAGRGEPVRKRLDSEGARVSVTLPHPEYLARTLGTATLFGVTEDLTLYRTGSSGVAHADESPVSLQARADVLVEGWAALPARTDEGAVYRDLRIVSTTSPGVARDYALQVLRRGRDLLEPAPARRPRRPGRGTRTPDRDRKRSSRERLREDEETSSRWLLAGYLSGWGDATEAPPPGEEVLRTALYGMARERLGDVVEEYAEDVTAPAPGSPSWFRDLAERLEEWEWRAEDEDLPLRPRVPGSRRFYSVADEVLGESREIRSRQHVYNVPDTRGGAVSLYTDEEIREAAEVREIVARLREQRERLGSRPAATGTVGAVVDLEERRRSR
ncbi:hypothetical protein GCM10009737_10030 [Nocardioides lentus]|uniref:Uncharacterized protein n=1 Tax=Nocardioides lentus TaxID=338077 RepID=A0ABP5ACX3_9ACTN